MTPEDRDETDSRARAHERQRDAGISRRRLHDRLVRLQETTPLRILDDTEREPILHGATRVSSFDFTYRARAVREAVDADTGVRPIVWQISS